MPVKPSQSGQRVLVLLEKIAELQPIGISALAKALDEDISATQRALQTLFHDGWIQAAPGKPTRWEMTARIHSVAHMAHGSYDLRHRSRPILVGLRDETGESVSLNVMDRNGFVVLDQVESRQPLRVVLSVGLSVPAAGSATGRAILPYMSLERQSEFLNGPPSASELKEYAATISRGYSISTDVVIVGFTNIGAAIFEADGRPSGAVLLSAPNERIPARNREKIGMLVKAAAEKLSRGYPPNMLVEVAKPTRAKKRA